MILSFSIICVNSTGVVEAPRIAEAMAEAEVTVVSPPIEPPDWEAPSETVWFT